MSDGLLWVFVLLGAVLTCLRKWSWSPMPVIEITKNTGLFTHFVVNWCCVGTHAAHNTSFQTIFHATGLVATQNTLI